jgi:hypothetical protein
VQLDATIFGELTCQCHTKLITQDINRHLRHAPRALRQFRRDQALEHIGVGQTASRRPFVGFQVLREEDLDVLSQGRRVVSGLRTSKIMSSLR